MSSAVKAITWVLLALWAVFTVVFLIKFHDYIQHPLQHTGGNGGGGIFLVVGQAALGAAVILIWQFGRREAG